MAKKAGPAAQNTVKKNLSMLFKFATGKLGYTSPNPARAAKMMKTNPDGYHTWTEDEIAQFLDCYPHGSKPRLVALLTLNTDMSRTDLSRLGRQHVTRMSGRLRIAYKRAKTAVAADLPILPELEAELALLPPDQLLFIVQDARPVGYKPETLGNWFRARCNEAGVPGSLHGLRKAGVTRLADAGATNREIASYLAHKDTTQADTCTRNANRSRLADSGFAKLQSVAKLSEALDRKARNGQP